MLHALVVGWELLGLHTEQTEEFAVSSLREEAVSLYSLLYRRVVYTIVESRSIITVPGVDSADNDATAATTITDDDDADDDDDVGGGVEMRSSECYYRSRTPPPPCL